MIGNKWAKSGMGLLRRNAPHSFYYVVVERAEEEKVSSRRGRSGVDRFVY